MADLDLQAGSSVTAPWPAAEHAVRTPHPAPAGNPRPRTAVRSGAPPVAMRPMTLLDPNAATLTLVRALRARSVPVVTLSARQLEPASFVRGVWRRTLPPLQERPECWNGVLLELAAKIEPRSLLVPCSQRAIAFLRERRRTLEPHFDLTGLEFSPDVPPTPDAALRRTLARGEAALEVQLVRDARGEITGTCVLAWAPAAMPDVLVSSVEGTDVAQRSAHWAATRGLVGYARLLWASDRFGRLALQAASPLPGVGLALALTDGVDFGALLHGALCGRELPACRPRLELVRRLPCLDPDSTEADVPLVDLPVRLQWHDPVPSLASWFRMLVQP